MINSVIAGVLFFCSTPIAFFNQLHGLIQLTSGAGDGDADELLIWAAGSSSGSEAFDNGTMVSDVAGLRGDTGQGLVLLQEMSTLGDRWPESIRRAVFEYLPSLIMVAVNLLVLTLMEIPARNFEMKATHSEIEAAIAW